MIDLNSSRLSKTFWSQARLNLSWPVANLRAARLILNFCLSIFLTTSADLSGSANF